MPIHSRDAARFSRRSLIAGAAVLPFSGSLARGLKAAESDASPGFVMREREPQNLESDFSALSAITPNNRFYVRNHFAVPVLDSKSWTLEVDGAVKNRLHLSYDELTQMPSETRPVTLECAGNGRVLLVPKVEGVQWQLGAVGTAEWTGVRLDSVLERAGIDPKATELVFEGADSGEPTKPSKPGKPIKFSRSVPIEKVRSGDVLLAFKMNGQPLPQAHGFPIRAIVPGWYGMASVKWLARIVAVMHPFRGYFQTVDYAYWQQHDGIMQRVPVTEMQVKSQIARPSIAEVVAKGKPYRIFGAAWAGSSAVSKVEISTDGGKNYAAAKLLGAPQKHAWRLWEFVWQVPDKTGKYILSARATDANGNTQPLERDKDREAYMISHVVPVEVRVQ